MSFYGVEWDLTVDAYRFDVGYDRDAPCGLNQRSVYVCERIPIQRMPLESVSGQWLLDAYLDAYLGANSPTPPLRRWSPTPPWRWRRLQMPGRARTWSWRTRDPRRSLDGRWMSSSRLSAGRGLGSGLGSGLGGARAGWT